jgi:hypothetical protein
LNLSNIEAVEPGERDKLPAGGYIVRIEGYEDDENNERVWFVFDVNEGQHAGFYSDAYYENKPFRHRVMMSYKETALGALKGRLEKITECNPGFDAVAAFQAAQLNMFVGKKIALVAGIEQDAFEGDNGWVATENVDWFHAKYTTLDKVRKGDFKTPEPTQTDAYKKHIGASPTQSAPSNVYGDIDL